MGDPSVPSDQLGDSTAVELTGKIMVVAIILLFMVVVFVLILHLYAKWFWWSTVGETTGPHPRRRRRRFVFAPGLDSAGGSHGALRRGLDPSVLKTLPVLVFPSQDFKEGLECAVCLSEVSEGEKARLLPKCNHGFHVDCIDMWFQSHSTCPLCRNPVASSQSPVSETGHNESSDAENSAESPVFPTNVLIWGNQAQVSSIGVSLEESSSTSQQPCSSSSSSAAATSNSDRPRGALVIDIPSEITSSSLSPSASRFAEDELKSPMTARLRSLKRLLSREKRFNPCSPSSVDVEQARGGQS